MPSFTCSTCGLIYKTKHSMRKHVSDFHPSVPVEGPRVITRSLLCSVCSESKSFTSKSDFLTHLAEVHESPHSDCEVNLKFESLDRFRAWKLAVERETGAFYRAACGATRTKYAKVLYYACNRSGHYKAKGQGMRQLKIQGSRRMGGYCPSDIRVKVGRDGKCDVTFFKKHWGHSADLQHLSLSPDERKRIADKIAAEVPLTDILHGVRQDVSGDLKRVHLLTKKDLYNIRSSARLSSEYAEQPRDAITGDIWTQETQSLESQPGEYSSSLHTSEDEVQIVNTPANIPQDAPFEVPVPEEETDDSSSKVCSVETNRLDHEKEAIRREMIVFLKDLTADVEKADTIEELMAAREIVVSLRQALAAARQGSGPVLPQKCSKRRTEPQRRRLDYCPTKKAKT